MTEIKSKGDFMESIENKVEENVLSADQIELALEKERMYLEHMEKIEYQTDRVQVFGSEEQRATMFAAFSGYTEEITNPDTTAANFFFKKADGSFSVYAPLDEVLNTVRPVLAKHGFAVFQSPTARTGEVEIQTILVHKCGGSISFPSLRLPTSKNDAQGVLATITYGRRSALNAILAIHGEVDDDGNAASGNDVTKPKGTAKASVTDDLAPIRKDLSKIGEELKKLGVDRELIKEAIVSSCGVANFNAVKELEPLQKTFEELKKLRDKAKGA